MHLFSLEPLLQKLRVDKAIQHMPKGGVLVDVGCDTTPVLLNRVCEDMNKCIGLDEVASKTNSGNIELMNVNIQKKLPLNRNTADVITLLAVLEHLEYPDEIVKECYRVLKPGGVLLLTVPAPKNEPLLNLLSSMGMVRKEMIDQHKNYFTRNRLRDIMEKAKFKDVYIEYFELGFNTFAKARK